MAKPKLYQYKDGDTPLTVANNFGLKPQDILEANPNATPFSTGQNINIPQNPGYFGLPPNLVQAGQGLPGLAPQSQSQGFNQFSGFRYTQSPFQSLISDISSDRDSGFNRMFRNVTPETVQQGPLGRPVTQTEVDFPSSAGSIQNIASRLEQAAMGATSIEEFDRLANNAYGRLTAEEQYAFQAFQAGLQRSEDGSQIGGDGSPVTRQQNIGGQDYFVNESGQRLNAQGQVVWDPKTAQRDVYGGRFRYAGEVRWSRNKKGRLVKQRLGKNNKWQTINKRGGGGGASSQPAGSGESQPPVTSVGIVSFNAGAG